MITHKCSLLLALAFLFIAPCFATVHDLQLFDFQIKVIQAATKPQVIALDDGGFFMTWQGNSENSSDIYGKIYNSNETVRTDEFLINTNVRDAHQFLAAVKSSTGDIILTWQIVDETNEDDPVETSYGCVIGTDGVKIVDDFAIHSEADLAGLLFKVIQTNSSYFYVSALNATDFTQPNIIHGINANHVLALSSGGFVSFSSTWIAIGQQYNASFTKIGMQYMINRDFVHSAVALEDGNMLLAWQKEGIFGRVFYPNGTAKGAVFTANTSIADDPASQASAVALPNGEFLLYWSNYGYSYGQFYNADQTRKGVEFPLNQGKIYNSPSLAVLQDSSVVAVAMDARPEYLQVYRFINTVPINWKETEEIDFVRDSDNNAGLIVGITLPCIIIAAVALFCVIRHIKEKRRAQLEYQRKMVPLTERNQLPLQHSIRTVKTQAHFPSQKKRKNGGMMYQTAHDMQLIAEEEDDALPVNYLPQEPNNLYFHQEFDSQKMQHPF